MDRGAMSECTEWGRSANDTQNDDADRIERAHLSVRDREQRPARSPLNVCLSFALCVLLPFQYSWPDGIVYIGEWVAGVQSGLGFKWSGLGTKAQFGRWLDNKFVQTLYVAPAILAKMPSWTVEEFQHELDTRWADYQRPTPVPVAATPIPTAATGGAHAGGAGSNVGGGGGAAGGAKGGKKGSAHAHSHSHAHTHNHAHNNHAHDKSAAGVNGSSGVGATGASSSSSSGVPCICTCVYKCQCKCSCPCAQCSATALTDEWAPEVFELIKRMRAAHEIEPHMLTSSRLARDEDRVN